MFWAQGRYPKVSEASLCLDREHNLMGPSVQPTTISFIIVNITAIIILSLSPFSCNRVKYKEKPKRFPFGLNASCLCHVWKWKNPLYNYHSDVWSQKMREKRTICRQKLQKCAINHWGCKENKMNWSDGFVLAEPSHNKRFYCCDHIVNKEMHWIFKAIPISNNEVNRRWGLWGKIPWVTKSNWNLDVAKRNSWIH